MIVDDPLEAYLCSGTNAWWKHIGFGMKSSWNPVLKAWLQCFIAESGYSSFSIGELCLSLSTNSLPAMCASIRGHFLLEPPVITRVPLLYRHWLDWFLFAIYKKFGEKRTLDAWKKLLGWLSIFSSPSFCPGLVFPLWSKFKLFKSKEILVFFILPKWLGGACSSWSNFKHWTNLNLSYSDQIYVILQ